MEKIGTVITPLIIGIIFVIVCNIYIILADKKQKEMEESHKEYIRKQQEKEDKWRREQSIKWNEHIQSKYHSKLKYKTNKPIKALIGDYTESMAPFTNQVLRSMGIYTEFVPSASDIIDRIDDGKKYDVIITNNIYPKGESGQKVLDTLKFKRNCGIPIIILTVDQNARNEYKSKGFDEYIEKPINEKKVIDIFPKVISDLKFTKIQIKNKQ